MHKLVAIIIFLLLQISALAQREGFLYIEKNPNAYSCTKYAIEADNGSFIAADISLVSSALTETSLFKLSASGELLKKVIVGENMELTGMCVDPDNNKQYYLIGDKVVNFEEYLFAPCIVHFDEDLNILSTVDVELPDELYKEHFDCKSLINSEKKVFFTASVIENGIPSQRLHLRFSLDGQLECHSFENGSSFAGSLFLFPDGSCGSYYGGNLSQFDDNLNLNLVHTFSEIVNELQGDDVSYNVSISGALHPTTIALSDSTVLIAEEAYEYWWNPYQGAEVIDYDQIAFFKGRFNGEVEKAIIEGSQDTLERPAYNQGIDYVYPNSIYLCGFQHLEPNSFGTLVIPNKIFLKKVDNDMNVIWEKSYRLGEEHYMPLHLLATQDGGCLVTGNIMYDIYESQRDIFVLKVNADGTVGTEEIIVEDLLPYTFWPNPAQSELHLHYSPDVKPAQIELYDQQGRLLRTQRNGLESINLEGLPAGVYTMRVTLEGGKVFSDKVVKE